MPRKPLKQVRISEPAATQWWKHTLAVVRAAVEWESVMSDPLQGNRDLRPGAQRSLLKATRAYRAWVSKRLDPAKRKAKR